MKKIYLIITIVLLTIILFTGNIYAQSNLVSLNISKTEVNQKDTFTITISANSSNNAAIDGLSAIVEYDKNILEMVSSDLVDSKNWSNLDTFPNLAAIWIPSTSETVSADIYIITFKVKEGITSENTEIKLKDIVLSTSDNEISVDDIAKTIKINKTDINKDDGNNADDNNKNDENNNDSNKEDENNKNNTNNDNKVDDSNKDNGNNDNDVDKSTNENNSNKTNDNVNNSKATDNISTNLANITTSKSALPYTGGILSKIIIALIVVVSICGIRGYTLYKKYKGI